jgi:hypothetical protein
LIVELLRRDLRSAERDHIDAVASMAAAVAGASAWDKANPEDGVGGMSQNPYNVSHAQRQEARTSQKVAEVKAALDYAVDTFIEGDAPTDP